MAWTTVFNSEDEVNTPHGRGKVLRDFGNGQVRVQVDGSLYDVGQSEISRADGGKAEKSDDIQVGDKVELLEKSGGAPNVGDIGTVKTVNDYGITVDFPAQGNYSTSKKDVKKVEAGQEPANSGDEFTREELKEGTKVQHKDHGNTGTITESTQRKITVQWKNAGKTEHSKQEVISGESPLKKPDEQKQEEQRQEQREERTPDTKARDTADDLYGLFNLKDKLEQKIESEVEGELKELRDMVRTKAKLEVKVGDKVNVVEGVKHKQLEQLISYSALRLSPLLVGMAGTGKTHAGTQVSEALGLPFYAMSVGAQTSKSDIIGYMSASGGYVTTHFRTAYENGGVFLMDEIDAGNANVLIQVNAALSNNYSAFPDAMVKRHPDFIFIASANTFGNGANRQYVGRNQLDAATLDRFAVIEWFIDDDLEESLAVGLNGKAWYMAVRAARDYVTEKKIRALVSPRATQKGSQLIGIGQPLSEVIEATMLASVPEDKKSDVKAVATKVFEKFASEVKTQLPAAVTQDVSDLVKDYNPDKIDLTEVPF